MPPLYATASQSDLVESLADGRLSIGALSADVAASRIYWATPATAEQIKIAYRLLGSSKVTTDIKDSEMRYMVNTFADDAIRNEISQGELEEGMQCYRDHGGPFLPKAFGDWRAAQDGHVFVSGKERHSRYAHSVGQIRSDVKTRMQSSAPVDLMDLVRRQEDAGKLFHLARRHSARCSYLGMQSKPCVLEDMEKQLRKVLLVPVSERTDRELEIIEYAESAAQMNPKSKSKSDFAKRTAA